jgi:large repetitive protein
MLYMDDAGVVYFGVYPGSMQTVHSAAGLNDGNWHMAAASLGPSGMALYIDGVQVATSANTAAEVHPTPGWWRVGCGNLLDWTWTGSKTAPASQGDYPFVGSLDEASIYTTVLPPQQIAFLYWVR